MSCWRQHLTLSVFFFLWICCDFRHFRIFPTRSDKSSIIFDTPIRGTRWTFTPTLPPENKDNEFSFISPKVGLSNKENVHHRHTHASPPSLPSLSEFKADTSKHYDEELIPPFLKVRHNNSRPACCAYGWPAPTDWLRDDFLPLLGRKARGAELVQNFIIILKACLTHALYLSSKEKATQVDLAS